MDLISAQQGLNAEQLQIFNGEMARSRRTPLVTYLLFFFLFWTGAHKFYLQQPRLGAVYIVLTLLCIPMVFFTGLIEAVTDLGKQHHGSPVAILLFLITAAMWIAYPICWLVDVFTIPVQVRSANNRMGVRLAEQLRGVDNG